MRRKFAVLHNDSRVQPKADAVEKRISLCNRLMEYWGQWFTGGWGPGGRGRAGRPSAQLHSPVGTVPAKSAVLQSMLASAVRVL